MPLFISSITGYDAATAKMYFNAGNYSSVNGRQFKDERMPSQSAAALDPSLLVPPVVVPGWDETRLENMSPQWSGTRTEYSATFAGLLRGQQLVLEWSSCCTS